MTWLQTGSGRAFDLLNPTAEMVDFIGDIAEASARLPRFNGHVRAGAYSVAQHQVVGSDTILRDLKRPDAALAFLLHDSHEAYINDQATVVTQSLNAIVNKLLLEAGATQELRDVYRRALRSLKERIDRAIFEAAGLPYPLAPEVAGIVHRYDLLMLATERAHLLGKSPRPWAPEIEALTPLRMARLTIWSWPVAAERWLDRLFKFLPQLKDRLLA